MPIWLICIGCLGFLCLCHIVWLFFCGCSIRDNIVFDNKYKRKIYQLNEKKKKYEDKINEKISYLSYKSIYCENVKILHEKDLNCTISMFSKDFFKSNKNRSK